MHPAKPGVFYQKGGTFPKKHRNPIQGCGADFYVLVCMWFF